MSNTKDHGFWTKYIPLKLSEGWPSGAMFLKRDSDGKDWYDHVHPQDQFEKDTVKVVVEVKGRDEAGNPVVRCAAVEADRLFPQEAQLIELLDEKAEQNEEALIEKYANRYIDLETGKIGARWVPPKLPIDDRVLKTMEEILRRLDRIEGKDG